MRDVAPATTPRRGAGPRLGALLGLTLAAKLLVLAWGLPARPGVVENPDTPTYVRPALALLLTGSFSPDASRAPEPELNRTPGYPALVAAVYALCGERPAALGVTSALLSTATIGLLFLLARRFVGEGAAFASAALLALDPGSFRYSLVALTEVPFTFLLLLGSLLLLRAGDEARRPVLLAFAGGLALACATLVRPLLYYFFPALALLLPVAMRRWRSGRMLGAFLAPVLVLVGGWQLRNHLRAGTSSLTLNQSVELYLIRGGYVQSLVEGASAQEVRDRLGWAEHLYRFGYVPDEKAAFDGRRYADLYPETSALPLAELARRYDRRGREILLGHPLEALRMVAHGTLYLFLTPPFFIWQFHWGGIELDEELLREYFYPRPLGVLSWLRRHEPVTFALTLLWIPLLALLAGCAARGALRALRRGPELLVVAAFAYLVAVTAGPSCIDDRYRVPIAPFLAYFAVRGREPRMPDDSGPAAASLQRFRKT